MVNAGYQRVEELHTEMQLLASAQPSQDAEISNVDNTGTQEAMIAAIELQVR